MGRAKTPALVRVKDAVLSLNDGEQDTLAEWLEMFIEVRDQDKERKRKKEQAAADRGDIPL